MNKIIIKQKAVAPISLIKGTGNITLNGVWTSAEVIDNLNSFSTADALSANMGRHLKELIDSIDITDEEGVSSISNAVESNDIRSFCLYVNIPEKVKGVHEDVVWFGNARVFVNPSGNLVLQDSATSKNCYMPCVYGVPIFIVGIVNNNKLTMYIPSFDFFCTTNIGADVTTNNIKMMCNHTYVYSIRTFNYALTREEVSKLYNNGRVMDVKLGDEYRHLITDEFLPSSITSTKWLNTGTNKGNDITFTNPVFTYDPPYKDVELIEGAPTSEPIAAGLMRVDTKNKRVFISVK